MASRVLLRAPALRDEDAFLEAVRRSRRLHRSYVHPPATPDAFRAFVRGGGSATHENHLIFERDSCELVGVLNVSEIVRGSFLSAYLGYYAFEPFAGRGLMSAGMALGLRHVFGALGLHRVEANIQPANERSIALVKRLGFRLEGLSPRYLKIAGRWRDHERWALLKEEWQRPRR